MLGGSDWSSQEGLSSHLLDEPKTGCLSAATGDPAESGRGGVVISGQAPDHPDGAGAARTSSSTRK
jgi:hypothetical protein